QCAIADHGNRLALLALQAGGDGHAQRRADGGAGVADAEGVVLAFRATREGGQAVLLAQAGHARSEEHTSELQSRENLVCRLLLDAAADEIYTLSLHDALPIFSAPSPITAIDLRFWPCRRAAMAMPSAAPMEVLEWPTPKVSYSLSVRRGKAARPSFWRRLAMRDRKSTRLNSSHVKISYAVFCLMRRPTRSTLFPYTTLFRSSVRHRRSRQSTCASGLAGGRRWPCPAPRRWRCWSGRRRRCRTRFPCDAGRRPGRPSGAGWPC